MHWKLLFASLAFSGLVALPGCAAETDGAEIVASQSQALVTLTADESAALDGARRAAPGTGRYRAMQRVTENIARAMIGRRGSSESDRRAVLRWRHEVLNGPEFQDDRMAVRRAIADERRAYTPTAADLRADADAARFMGTWP